MSRWLYMFRFFLVVPPMPFLMIGAFAVITVAIAAVVVLHPSRATGALTPILLLQLFACSSGFDVPARRGHYDLLLTHAGSRRVVALGHWAASACPGIVCWLTLAAVCRIAVGTDAGGLLLSTGSVVAVCLVSTIPWATTLRLPRFSGAIGWLLIVAMIAFVAQQPFVVGPERPIDGWASWIHTAWTVLLYPPALVGRSPQGVEALAAMPSLLVAMSTLGIALWSVHHRDIPLEAAQ
jgi:hypothetical protein